MSLIILIPQMEFSRDADPYYDLIRPVPGLMGIRAAAFLWVYLIAKS